MIKKGIACFPFSPRFLYLSLYGGESIVMVRTYKTLLLTLSRILLATPNASWAKSRE